jgi:hypothetical protein
MEVGRSRKMSHAIMMVHRWKNPLVLGDSRMRIGSAEEPMNWLVHEHTRALTNGGALKKAGRDAIAGRMRAEDARKAVQLAATR